jgi:hypothetical protein
MRMEIVENVYNKLNEVSIGNVSMRFFSKTWLGKDPSYIGHIKSTGEDVSNDVIVGMLGRMIKARVQAEQDQLTNREDDRELMEIYKHKIEVYRGLEHYIDSAIYEHAAKSQGVIF